MRPGDGLLLGADLAPVEGADVPQGCKCVAELVDAYADADGVTAAFNRNLLTRLNRELGADFDSEAFTHRAVWNKTASRMEMHLESREEQSVWISALEAEVQFAAGEWLHTENSYKYTAEQVAGLMALAGFPVERHWLAGPAPEPSTIHERRGLQCCWGGSLKPFPPPGIRFRIGSASLSTKRTKSRIRTWCAPSCFLQITLLGVAYPDEQDVVRR